jgi:hypothetical protein
MNKYGVYILANDIVYDQLVALLNSIEANVSRDISICIIPYDKRLNLVQQEIKSRKNVTLFADDKSLGRWDDFADQIWASHSLAQQANLSRNSLYKTPLLRKLSAFDGEFDKFVFYDADSLAMKPLDDVFAKLDTYDFIFDDWEHKKSQEATALNIPLIEKTGIYQEENVRPKLHCSSFFASKRGIFAPAEIESIKKLLIEQKEVEWVTRWWDDAFLFNYMTLRCDRPLFNYTLSPNGEDRTGNCANADPFVNIDNVLYNQEGLKPIYRIHYMSYSSADFARLSKGEDVNIRYQDEFLHYRFLNQPEQKPKALKQPNKFTKVNRLSQKIIQKFKRAIA